MLSDPDLAMTEIPPAIAEDILTMQELADDPDWDTFAMIAEVTDTYVAVTAYRYTESGPPVSTSEPERDELFDELRERTRGTNGVAWDVAIVKIHRDTANLVMNFVSGEAAEMYRIIPENTDRLPELIRPRPEDFLPV